MAEGAQTREEAAQKRKDRQPSDNPYRTVAHKVAEAVQQQTGLEARAVVPGQRFQSQPGWA